MVTTDPAIPARARHGTGDWFLQRLTAVVLVAYTVALVGVLIACKPTTYALWTEVFASAVFRAASFVAFVALLYHAWVGVRDIIMDYIQPAGVRSIAYLLVALGLIACLAWSATIFWGR